MISWGTISDGAISDIPEAIVEGQTLAVDVVAGATYTSNGIIEAVKKCVEQAGGDVDSLLSNVKEKEYTNVEKSADVVVVGGGAAGLAVLGYQLRESGFQGLAVQAAACDGLPGGFPAVALKDFRPLVNHLHFD